MCYVLLLIYLYFANFYYVNRLINYGLVYIISFWISEIIFCLVADCSLRQTHASEHIVLPAEDVNGEEAYNPENGHALIEEEEAPVPEVVDEIPDDSLVVAGSTSIIEEVPKKSYASIVSSYSELPYDVS